MMIHVLREDGTPAFEDDKFALALAHGCYESNRAARGFFGDRLPAWDEVPETERAKLAEDCKRVLDGSLYGRTRDENLAYGKSVEASPLPEKLRHMIRHYTALGLCQVLYEGQRAKAARTLYPEPTSAGILVGGTAELTDEEAIDAIERLLNADDGSCAHCDALEASDDDAEGGYVGEDFEGLQEPSGFGENP